MELTPNQNKAIALLVQGRSVTEVAEECGVARSTLWNWRQEPEFAAALQNELDSVRDASTNSLVNAVTSAIQTLVNIFEDSEVNPQVRTLAATAILNKGLPSLSESKVRADVKSSHVDESRKWERWNELLVQWAAAEDEDEPNRDVISSGGLAQDENAEYEEMVATAEAKRREREAEAAQEPKRQRAGAPPTGGRLKSRLK